MAPSGPMTASGATNNSPKHVRIDEAIARVRRITEKLDEMLAAINGVPTQGNKLVAQTSAVSLAEVLETTADKLSKEVETQYNLLDTIQKTLF